MSSASLGVFRSTACERFMKFVTQSHPFLTGWRFESNPAPGFASWKRQTRVSYLDQRWSRTKGNAGMVLFDLLQKKGNGRSAMTTPTGFEPLADALRYNGAV